MPKIAAFINFSDGINSLINNKKKEVKKLFGEQIYLSHPVHSTLFTTNISNISTFIEKFQNNFINKSIKLKPITLNLIKTGIFINDELTKGNTIYYLIKKNYFFEKYQLILLDFIKNLGLIKYEKINFNHKWMNDNFLKYGYPYIGNKWIPHITVASIKNVNAKHPFFINFLNTEINKSDVIKYISFYEVVDDDHNFLFKIPLL